MCPDCSLVCHAIPAGLYTPGQTGSRGSVDVCFLWGTLTFGVYVHTYLSNLRNEGMRFFEGIMGMLMWDFEYMHDLRTCTHIHVRMFTCTRTHMHTYAHVYKHTYVQATGARPYAGKVGAEDEGGVDMRIVWWLTHSNAHCLHIRWRETGRNWQGVSVCVVVLCVCVSVHQSECQVTLVICLA